MSVQPAGAHLAGRDHQIDTHILPGPSFHGSNRYTVRHGKNGLDFAAAAGEAAEQPTLLYCFIGHRHNRSVSHKLHWLQIRTTSGVLLHAGKHWDSCGTTHGHWRGNVRPRTGGECSHVRTNGFAFTFCSKQPYLRGATQLGPAIAELRGATWSQGHPSNPRELVDS